MIGVIDYGVGNIRAFLNIYQKLSVPVKTIRKRDDFVGINKMMSPALQACDKKVVTKFTKYCLEN